MRFNASSATEPSVTITRGLTTSIVRRRKLEQFFNSCWAGFRFAPDSDRGLQSAALVMKISFRVNLIEFRKRSKFAPDWSPENGMRVRSAPLRPGASPINITRASDEPLSSLRTALRPHIAGQSVQLEASFTNLLKESLVIASNDGVATEGHPYKKATDTLRRGGPPWPPHGLSFSDGYVACDDVVSIRPAIGTDQFKPNRVFALNPSG